MIAIGRGSPLVLTSRGVIDFEVNEVSLGLAPYILAHEGQVTLFRSLEALARGIEAPDLGGARAFDSEGRVILLASPPVRKRFGFVNVPPVTATPTEFVEEGELREVLLNYVIDREGLSVEALSEASLAMLVSRVESMGGVLR